MAEGAGAYLVDNGGCTLDERRGPESIPPVRTAMTFFTTDDHTVPQDTLDVLAASSLLQITEFHLFELAYQRWFGRQAKEDELEACFARYMFASSAPHWVRQFCRDVSIKDNDDALDPRDFGVLPRPVSETLARRGMRQAALLILILVTVHLVVILITTA